MGIPDVYDPAVTAAQWPLVVSIRIYLLVRSPEATTGYTDTKTYDFSNTTVSLGPFNDAFKRHVLFLRSQADESCRKKGDP